MHYKDLLGSIVRVGYCIPFQDFYLVLHACDIEKAFKLINHNLIRRHTWVLTHLIQEVHINSIPYVADKESVIISY